MKFFSLKLLFITAMLISGEIVYAQTTFFKHDNSNMYSFIHDAKDYQYYCFLSGGVSNIHVTTYNQLYFHPFLYKMDIYGNIVSSYIDNSDSSFFLTPVVEVLDDTIYMFYYIIHELNNGFNNELKACKFDNQLNLISSKSYFYYDSLHYYSALYTMKDRDDNFLLTGGIWGIYAGGSGFLFKLNRNCDTLINRFVSNLSLRPIDIIEKNDYLSAKDNNYFLYFDKDLHETGQISVMDTFFSAYTNIAQLGVDSILMVGYKMEVNPYDKKRNMLFKTTDFQGNIIDFYQINTPDSVNFPSFVNAIAIKGNIEYFSWYKQKYTEQGNSHPSIIGVGKFNKSLQPQWIKYFGKPNTFYGNSKIFPNIDGGCTIVGEYKKTSFSNNNIRYFILKVNSQGLATFFKHTDIKVQSKLNLYPNPAQDEIAISLTGKYQALKSIQILDLQGKQILQKQVNAKQTKLDVSSLPTGVYLLSGETTTGEKFNRKFVKE